MCSRTSRAFSSVCRRSAASARSAAKSRAARGRDLGEADQALAGAEDLLGRGQIVLEGAPGQLLDRVLDLAAVEHVGHQHRAVIGRDRDAVAQQQVRHALHVVADLEHAGVFEQRLQPGERRDRRGCAGAPRGAGGAVEQPRCRRRRAVAERHIGRQPRRDAPARCRRIPAGCRRARSAPAQIATAPACSAASIQWSSPSARVDDRIGALGRKRRDLRDDRLARSRRSRDRRR